MIHEIRHAFNDLLEENEWMDVETRLVAEDKANSMNERIGYPEYITNQTRLEEEYQNVGTHLIFNSEVVLWIWNSAGLLILDGCWAKKKFYWCRSVYIIWSLSNFRFSQISKAFSKICGSLQVTKVLDFKFKP